MKKIIVVVVPVRSPRNSIYTRSMIAETCNCKKKFMTFFCLNLKIKIEANLVRMEHEHRELLLRMHPWRQLRDNLDLAYSKRV